MDGELAYILGGFSKLKLFEGGASFIAARKALELEDFCVNLGKEEYELAWKVMIDGVIKAVAMMRASFKEDVREIILTGRLSRVKKLYSNLERTLSEKFNVKVRRPLHNFAKEAKDVA